MEEKEIEEELMKLYESGVKLFSKSTPFKLQNIEVHKQQEYYYISYYFKPVRYSFFPKTLTLNLKNIDEIRREENCLKFSYIITNEEELQRQIDRIKEFINYHKGGVV